MTMLAMGLYTNPNDPALQYAQETLHNQLKAVEWSAPDYWNPDGTPNVDAINAFLGTSYTAQDFATYLPNLRIDNLDLSLPTVNPFYSSYFLAAPSSVVQLETFEMSHPSWSQVYRIVRNSTATLNAGIEGGATAQFEYYPCKIVAKTAKDDLDFVMEITFGDLGEIMPLELDRMRRYPNGLLVKPNVIYRAYRSDDLAFPMIGPIKLEMGVTTFSREGMTFEARAPLLNATRTGEIYSIVRFPMIKGFV